MSPRPKKATDDEIFAAAMKVMARVGPAELTLADIAAEAGLTAGALVQRFGSKRGLQVTMAERLAESSGAIFAGLAARHRSPAAALYAYGDGMAQMAVTPAALARNLAWLLQDLTDPELRRHTVAHGHGTRRELRRLAEAAIAEGELIKTADPAAIARALEVTVGGSLLAWAFYQEGPAAAWVRHDVDTILHPVLTPKGRARAKATRLPRRTKPRGA
jgi:AcrR family transcriptional regulator